MDSKPNLRKQKKQLFQSDEKNEHNWETVEKSKSKEGN